MSRSGNVVYLPFDLRVPFARHVVRSKINHLKRFNIATVFREKKIFGLQPRERFECAFDIVGPTKNVISDAEVLLVTDEIMREFESFRGSGYFFRLNHVNLLKGILNHFGISDHLLVHEVIRAAGINSKKVRMATLAQHIPEQVVANLFNILEREGSHDQLASALRPMMKRNNDSGNVIKKAMNELEAIVNHAELLGVKSKIIISPSLVFQPEYFSGMICQLFIKRKRGYEILACGGRFDGLISSFASKLNIEERSTCPPCGVGISIGLDILAASIQDFELEKNLVRLDVLIYGPSVKQTKLELARELWSRGVKCSICDPGWSIDDVQDHALECGASLIVIYQYANARIRHLVNERFTEKKVAVNELLETVLKHIDEQTTSLSAVSSSGPLVRMDSVTRILESNTPHFNIEWQFFPDRKNATIKKRLESSISSKMTPILNSFNASTFVTVLVLSYSGSVIRSLVATMDFDDESKYNDCLKDLCAKHSRVKKELVDVCEYINELKVCKGIISCVFVLYSSEEHSFKVLML